MAGMVMTLALLTDWIAEGGLIAQIIVIAGTAALVLGAWRIITLWQILRAVKRESSEGNGGMKNIAPHNPLARVMLVHADCANGKSDNSGDDSDAAKTLEWRLEEAYLRELPPLRFGLGVLALCATILPMLGLLGTVLGMMDAIQAMTLVADRTAMMASGISYALITTVLGLTFAIPIVLLHATATAHVKSITARLEEYCAWALAHEMANKIANELPRGQTDKQHNTRHDDMGAK